MIDGENMPNFDNQQFEGVFEAPLRTRGLIGLGVFCLGVALLLSGRLFVLQVVQGSDYLAISEQNRLDHIPIFNDRGVIFDRNGVELAWNESKNKEDEFARRSYYTEPGFGFLGYVQYPQKDDKGFYWQMDMSGVAGVEKLLNTELAGQQGIILQETNAILEVQSENIAQAPVDGNNVTLTIDSRLQAAMYKHIAELAESEGYQGGAGVLLDIDDGSIVALVTYPDFDPNILANPPSSKAVSDLLNDPRERFLNRALSGLYTPGSIIKPFIGLAALDKGVITQTTKILSTGSIEVPNRYDPDNPATFRDWRPEGHGNVDIRRAIADSVNTFFYAISGGYRNQEGIGIDAINTYVEAFGFGRSTSLGLSSEPDGVVPSPEWKESVFGDSWRLGDTYITSIGQFGFQVTPLQVARAIAAVANSGLVLRPHIVSTEPLSIEHAIRIKPEHFATIQSGMRDTVTEGTAQTLNFSSVHVAAKTGTAQVGVGNTYTNSWSTGFFPYEDPQYAFAVVMERGPKDDARSASWVMRSFLQFMNTLTPEYFGGERVADENWMAVYNNFYGISLSEAPALEEETDLEATEVLVDDVPINP